MVEDRSGASVTAGVVVVVVDDEPMVCDFLSAMLTSTGQITVAAVAHDGADGVEAVRRHRPHVVLMDLRMPGVDGVTAIQEIVATSHPPAVVAMTTFDTDEHLQAALDAGAAGFLLKTTPPDRLIPFVLAAAAGAVVLSPPALQRLRGQADTPVDPMSQDPQLTALPRRERQVLELIADGMSNVDIAARLYLSEGTVKGYVSRLMAHLGCQNRTQLALRVVTRAP